MTNLARDRLDPRLESLLEHVEWARGLAGRLVADAARADDVVQSALAAAVKSPPREATNLRGWLGEVVRNAARGIGREEGRRASRERAAAKLEALEGADELVARAEMTRDLATEGPFQSNRRAVMGSRAATRPYFALPCARRSCTKMSASNHTPPPAAPTKHRIASPGYPHSSNLVCTRIRSAAPTISAASTIPAVIRFAIFCIASIK